MAASVPCCCARVCACTNNDEREHPAAHTTNSERRLTHTPYAEDEIAYPDNCTRRGEQIAAQWTDGPASAALRAGVVAVAGLDGVLGFVFAGEGEVDLMVALGCGIALGCEADAVLAAQLLADLIEDVGYSLFLRDLEDAAAGLLRDTLQDLLAVDALFLPAARAAATSAAARVATSAAREPASATAVATTGLLALEVDGVDDAVGSLRGFNRIGQPLLRAAVHAVGQHDQRLAALLL